jgi:hypothetical protein
MRLGIRATALQHQLGLRGRPSLALSPALVILALLVALAGLSSVHQATAQVGPAASEWVTVLEAKGSDKLVVRNEAGLSYRVQYIGLRGPVRSSTQASDAVAFHAPLVLGQRLLLESDGRDEDGGYGLRHAYLASDLTTPIGARVLAAGWALAVPYPIDHRYRELYLQLQQQAMAQQLNFWGPGLFGPLTAWHAPNGAPGYVPADPDLSGALDLLYSVPTGQEILGRLLRTSPPLLFRELSDGLGGFAQPLGHYAVLSRRVGRANQRSLAAAIAHEATHTIDFATGELQLTDYGCFELEQRSHGIQAQVWAEFYGPDGKPDPRDAWDRATNDILRFARRGDLENYVRRSAGYEAQCARERIGG